MQVSSRIAPTSFRTNLDHLRWIAALAVVFQHARALVMVDYTPNAGLFAKLVFFAAGFSHQAVIIFFVLSGYLVGGKAWRMVAEGSSTDQRRRFVLDRFSRIATVLWPALILTGLIALVAPLSPVLVTAGWSADLPNIIAASQPGQWLATAFMFNEILAPTIAYNGPLWSLAYEWTYYIVAAAVIFGAGRERSALSALMVGYGLVLVALSAWLHPQLLWMLCFWLAGAAASRISSWQCPIVSVPVFGATIVLSRFLQPGAQVDAAVAIATAILIADRSFQASQPVPRLGAALASFSFSLYAIHWPIMLLLVAGVQRSGFILQRLDPGAKAYASIGLLVAVSYAVAWLFALCTEQRTATVRGWLERRRSPVSSPTEQLTI